MSAVNSWNEWDPLREVIVGTARGAVEMDYEPALSPYFTDEVPVARGAARRIPETLIDEAERQLDYLAALLDRMGVCVRRPDPVDHAVSVKAPGWEASGGHATACPRDVLLVIGDEIIEAPMSQRARYFEFRAYRRLVAEYFRGGARWTAAPKPLMTDALYQPRTPFDYADGPLLSEAEPVFDAACFARCGRDIFWQPDLVSNELGAEWLARHLGAEFRLHRIGFRERVPTHIDTTLVPIRPGLVLSNPQRPCTDEGTRLFIDNGWEVVEAPPSVRTGRQPAFDVSNWISLNVLMLDPRTALVEAGEAPMAALLRARGCEVIPVPFDRVYGFGGGLHCCTVDIHREGRLESYFPKLDGASREQSQEARRHS